MQFTHLFLENWRNFSRVDVELSPRMFVMGPNASGKSNLLDAFRFLRDIAKPGGGFQSAVMDHGGVSAIRCFAARQNSDVTVEATVADNSASSEEVVWKYRIQFTQDMHARRPLLKSEQIWLNNRELLNRPDEKDKSDEDRLTQTHLEQVNVNKDFRALARFFQSVQYLHVIPHIIKEPDRYVPRNGDPFGGDFMERLAKTTERTRKARLKKIQEALKIAAPQLTHLEFRKDERGVPHLRALYKHWRPNAGWQNERWFSDGTLRLLGLLWSLLDGQGPLLLEEPELSLHAAIVRRIAGMIHQIQKRSQRQVLLSTHSYDLINEKGIGGEEVLVLAPTAEGTSVMLGRDDKTIRTLLESGASAADAILPATEPRNAGQLELF